MKQGIDQARELLAGKSVKWHTDCANIVRIIKWGSMKPQLLALALRIYDITRQHRIHLHVEWVPREQNVQADYYSRVVDYDDWGVKPEVVHFLACHWGAPDIDRFADASNSHCHHFNS